MKVSGKPMCQLPPQPAAQNANDDGRSHQQGDKDQNAQQKFGRQYHLAGADAAPGNVNTLMNPGKKRMGERWIGTANDDEPGSGTADENVGMGGPHAAECL